MTPLLRQCLEGPVEELGDEFCGALRPDGLVAIPLPEVLFVCEHNAGRSQMAAALRGPPGCRWLDHRVWQLLETLVPGGDVIAINQLRRGTH